MTTATRVFMSSTSYPRTEDDWQGVFIRHIASALAQREDLQLGLWAPDGPRHPNIDYHCDEADRLWLQQLAEQGGIAHLIRNNKPRALQKGLGLLRKLRRQYRSQAASTDVFHINWLQNALPLAGLDTPALVTILGTDFKMLELPGMEQLLAHVLRQRRCALAPNAEWMVPELERRFGHLTEVRPVAFGIDDRWYQLQRRPEREPAIWLAVYRVTADKIGPLFDWGEQLFSSGERELHLIGPNQDGLAIPDWVRFHGPASPEQLLQEWFPRAQGLLTLSQHAEGRPQVMLEAMAAGLPIIASDLPAHRDFIEHQRTGYLVDSSEQFGSALAWLELATNNLDVAGNCRQFAYDAYGTWADCAGRYRDIYRSLLE
jgi:hypothetical protein